MYLLQATTVFNWKEILLGSQPWSFLPEVILRTIIMFVILFVSLRLLGKRGVKQLSIFELVVIISLGTAAGDPMMYKDVGVLPALLVFAVIVGLYSLITYFIGRNKHFEKMVEGKPVYLIRNGFFSIDNFSKEVLGEDEFFAELRMQGVSQLGQVEEAIVESSGNISIFYYPEEAVKSGLPIMPDSLESGQQEIKERAHYACTFCGFTQQLNPAANAICPECKKTKWVKASNKKRIR
ncbi:DUF421 domain-containing protein [Lacibacter sp.]|uniref:DUF421 domain-containing protein n=1 Tax=Lacibacter sp. TaxID=1915409 RepID=UPI002B4B3A9F|nr:YetF domain-containing protein [Lacibacter sp.]HLP39080.1 YetF domain-containing protein [Lacibacter sp.]